MKANKKWLCVASLIVAGLMSLGLSFFGGFGLLWAGFPRKDHSGPLLGMFLPFLVAFFLFALAAAGSKLASLALWLCAPFPWLAVFETSKGSFKGGPIDFLLLLARCTWLAWPLLILAALVQFGIQIHDYRDTN